ncbi:hypothetical protein DFA_05835 [Cavenderia fasciculata]|uniref:Transmembrane protein n=1 Tax=Cavenderia fasciculata TaxID=261658 RepID=F4PMV7_CACFS|nr:uncharacterized protein DFA_05835 [Cavenderia fasciculata]EGG23701.1 hypothetical protein DFA_05835 [Cavenderia fasciculata]|eukprot:XP_004361552.1 hypothetical protein DFA_05835 [Cavenderia fasciculata]
MTERFRNSIYSFSQFVDPSVRNSSSKHDSLGDETEKGGNGVISIDDNNNNNNNFNIKHKSVELNNILSTSKSTDSFASDENNKRNKRSAMAISTSISTSSNITINKTIGEQLREEAINDQLTEGSYERYFNTIAYRKVVVLVCAAIVLQLALTGATYVKFGNYVFMRDAAVTTELATTIIAALTVIFFPKSTSRVQVVYLLILLLTNNMTRLMWEDWFPPFEPSYQMFIWINLSLPTAKFSRSIWTGTIGIVSIVIIRIAQEYDTVANVIVTQGGAYFLYQVSAAFGQRIIEVAQRCLFTELVNIDPFRSPIELYHIFHRFYISQSSRLTLKFRDALIESRFHEFYAKESTLELGVVFSTVITSIYYVIQDIHYCKPGTLPFYIALRFAVIIPLTCSLLYVSVLRKKTPFKADFIALIILIILEIVQVAMYTQTNSLYGSFYYFGGVMRVLTLGSAQLFFLFFAVLLPFSFIIVPFALTLFAPSSSINYLLFLIIFAIVVASFNYLREQNQRLRFLVKYLATEALEYESDRLKALEVKNQNKDQTSGQEKQQQEQQEQSSAVELETIVVSSEPNTVAEQEKKDVPLNTSVIISESDNSTSSSANSTPRRKNILRKESLMNNSQNSISSSRSSSSCSDDNNSTSSQS